MKNIKNYNQFVNEDWKKNLVTGAIAASTLFGAGCSNISKQTDKTEQTTKSKFSIPDEVTLKEKVLAIGTDFKIIGNDQIGTIKQKVVNITTTFDMYDNDENLVARSEKKLISWGSKTEIYDENHNKIGSIEEEILKSLFKVVTEYRIFDTNGKQ